MMSCNEVSTYDPPDKYQPKIIPAREHLSHIKFKFNILKSVVHSAIYIFLNGDWSEIT